MSDNVKALRAEKHPARAGLVALLKDLLAEAESGNLIAIVGGAQRIGLETSSFRFHDVDSDAAKLIFAIETVKFRMLADDNLERVNS